MRGFFERIRGACNFAGMILLPIAKLAVAIPADNNERPAKFLPLKVVLFQNERIAFRAIDASSGS